MRRLQTLYLSGPDLHYPDSGELLARKRLVCAAAGLTAKDIVRVASEAARRDALPMASNQ